MMFTYMAEDDHFRTHIILLFCPAAAVSTAVVTVNYVCVKNKYAFRYDHSTRLLWHDKSNSTFYALIAVVYINTKYNIYIVKDARLSEWTPWISFDNNRN